MNLLQGSPGAGGHPLSAAFHEPFTGQMGKREKTVLTERDGPMKREIESRAISRVMSGVIIYLGRLLPAASSNQPGAGGPRHRSCSVLLRMGFTWLRLLPAAR